MANNDYSSELMDPKSLARFRGHLGLSQREFAESLGISAAVIANFESGRTPLTEERLNALLLEIPNVSARRIDLGDFGIDRKGFLEAVQGPIEGWALQLDYVDAVFSAARDLVEDVEGRAAVHALLDAANRIVSAVGFDALNVVLARRKQVHSRQTLSRRELVSLVPETANRISEGEKTLDCFLTTSKHLQKSGSVDDVHSLTILAGPKVEVVDDIDLSGKALKVLGGLCTHSARSRKAKRTEMV